MCNLYSVGRNPNTDRLRWEKQVRGALQELNKVYGIRPTDPGLVLTRPEPGADTEVTKMRWGFSRRGFNSINNARGDNLEKGMWKQSFKERRCLVPADCIYEWNGPKKAKQAHAFFRPEGGWMWIAGVWEENPVHGKCFSMITTPPNALLEPLHDRMVAILDEAEAEAFLQGEMTFGDFEVPRPGVPLATFPCENPLKMKEIGPPVPLAVEMVQEDLFG